MIFIEPGVSPEWAVQEVQIVLRWMQEEPDLVRVLINETGSAYGTSEFGKLMWLYQIRQSNEQLLLWAN